MIAPARIRPQDIDILDIAHHLARMPRFAGATKGEHAYSVAQHSVYVSRLCHRDWSLEGLLHDAEEAYLLDMPHPIKHTAAMEAYRQWGDAIRKRILEKFGLQLEKHISIIEADDRICETETRDLMPPLPPGFEYRRHPERAYPNLHITPWTFHKAKTRFLTRFAELQRR